MCWLKIYILYAATVARTNCFQREIFYGSDYLIGTLCLMDAIFAVLGHFFSVEISSNFVHNRFKFKIKLRLVPRNYINSIDYMKFLFYLKPFFSLRCKLPGSMRDEVEYEVKKKQSLC